MKILRTITSFYPCVTGPIKQAFRISSEIEKRGISSPILTTYFGVNDPSFKKVFNNVHVIRYRNQFRIMKYCISVGLIKGLLQECDIIHSHEYRAFQSDIGCLIANIRKKPFVINTHGNLLCYKYILKGILPKLPYILHDLYTLKSAAKRADKIVVSSKVEYDDAVRFGIEKKKIEIIPPGIDISFCNNDSRMKEDEAVLDVENKLKLLFVGRLSPDRNIESILHAIKKLPNIAFYVVGEELTTSGFSRGIYLKTLKSLVSQLGINNRVNFVGAQYGDNLINYYKKSDIFINTSKYESFGQAIAEAAAHCLPVISTPVGIANEIIKDKYTGFIVNDDPVFIAQRIREFFSRKLREEFGSRLKGLVRENFDWNIIADKYIKLYEKLTH